MSGKLNPDVTVVGLDECYQLIKAIRDTVFIVEQGVPSELEWTGDDEKYLHILARIRGVAIGTARMSLEGNIGRMAVNKQYRQFGIGSSMLRFLISYARDNLDVSVLFLNSQLHAIPFYEKYHFKCYGESFIDAGIEHIHMRLNI